jgi:two-component system, chemotaxis family, response regulator Rcp1
MIDYMTSNGMRPAVVLLVDDDAGDRELTRRALHQDVYCTDLRMACDGEQAMDYLLHRGEYGGIDSSPLPDLILLDLNMPKLSGREVLRQLKSDPRLKTIPTVILTTSQQEEDILRSYELGCNSYIMKPVQLSAFTSYLQQLGTYWFQLVTKPSHPN